MTIVMAHTLRAHTHSSSKMANDKRADYILFGSVCHVRSK